ncbi:MAG: sugar ABC transporter substrate-binding protein [Clostridiales bacterium]|nr:sugar ABC transporter substrate-binding protein [Clostridiales bacterium]
MKKLLLFLVILGLMTASLGALAQQEVTLSVLWFNDANESEVFEDTVKDYLEQNPHVKLDMQVIAFSEFEQKLKLMISGGNAPDLARLPTALLPVFLPTLEPVDGYVDDIEAVKAGFMPAMMAYALSPDGKMVAYPTEATGNGMLVNKTAFDKAGIDVAALSQEWTWAQWEEAARKVIDANDNIKYGLAVDFTPHRFSTILYQFGGRMLNEDLTAVAFNNPKTIEMLSWFKRMHDEELIPKSVWMGSEKANELFQAGIAAAHIGGSWNINGYSKDITDFEWMAVRNPKGEINSSVPGGKFIASFQQSPNKQEAQKLMAWFSDATHNAMYCAGTFNLTSRVDAEVNYTANKENFDTFAEDLKVTPAYAAQEWNSPLVGKASAIIREQVVQMLMGNLTPEQAAAEIDAQAAALAQ